MRRLLLLLSETVVGNIIAWLITLGLVVGVLVLNPFRKESVDWWVVIGICSFAMVAMTLALGTHKRKKKEG